MMNSFYDNLAELEEEIDASFPYKSLEELSRSANDFERADIARMLIYALTDMTIRALDTVDYRLPVINEMEKRDCFANMAINCIRAAAGTTPYNDIGLVQSLLEQLRYIAYKSYSPKAYRALFDIELESTADKE